ncbi:glycosyltransferase family 4 protein, partial [Candidatus Parcubacteria bacterium]|nr:glycosyltransferase family 4 protein [Candidatus Parcubacteria bacterium]
MNKVKVLMFGWEFPPFNSGGLGVACEGLTRALSQQDIEIIFVLPKKIDIKNNFCRFVFASGIGAILFNSFLSPYLSCFSYQNRTKADGQNFVNDLMNEVQRYALWARSIAHKEKYDLIHAHDWLSFPAALEAKRISHKPLVMQMHATEFDRTGGFNLNQEIYEIEKQGMLLADVVVAVSNFTKDKIVKHYGINLDKVKVVHNAVNQIENPEDKLIESIFLKKDSKLVLFLGRITLQKGPDYFLLAAKEVLQHRRDVFFIIAGDGDMKNQIINQAIALGIADRVIFTGF